MADLHLYDIIVRPIVTEHSTGLADVQNQYVFEVHSAATKPQIKAAIETIFDKKVVKVNTMIMPAKRGLRGRRAYWRSKEWKKAIVTLSPGDKIDLFEV